MTSSPDNTGPLTMSGSMGATDSEWDEDHEAVCSGQDEEADNDYQTHQDTTELVFERISICRPPMHSKLTRKLQNGAAGKQVQRKGVGAVWSEKETKRYLLTELHKDHKEALLRDKTSKKTPVSRRKPEDSTLQNTDMPFSDRRYMGDFLDTADDESKDKHETVDQNPEDEHEH